MRISSGFRGSRVVICFIMIYSVITSCIIFAKRYTLNIYMPDIDFNKLVQKGDYTLQSQGFRKYNGMTIKCQDTIIRFFKTHNCFYSKTLLFSYIRELYIFVLNNLYRSPLIARIYNINKYYKVLAATISSCLKYNCAYGDQHRYSRQYSVKRHAYVREITFFFFFFFWSLYKCLRSFLNLSLIDITLSFNQYDMPGGIIIGCG